MTSRAEDNQKFVKSVELARKISEQKARQAAHSEAVRRAREEIKDRKRFVPKQPEWSSFGSGVTRNEGLD